MLELAWTADFFKGGWEHDSYSHPGFVSRLVGPGKCNFILGEFWE